MISKEEKYKRDMQRPGFPGSEKTRVWPKNLRFIEITIFSSNIFFYENSIE